MYLSRESNEECECDERTVKCVWRGETQKKERNVLNRVWVWEYETVRENKQKRSDKMMNERGVEGRVEQRERNEKEWKMISK